MGSSLGTRYATCRTAFEAKISLARLGFTKLFQGSDFRRKAPRPPERANKN